MADLAIVRWDDTTNIAAWQSSTEVQEFAKNGGWRCENVGWVVHDDEDCIVLSSRRTIEGDQQYGLTERIPRAAVISMLVLEPSGTMRVEP